MGARASRLIAACALALTLSGCGAVAGLLGATASIATAFGTGNPVIGISVGIGVKAAAEQGIQYLSRRKQHEVQTAVVTAAQDIAVGERARYQHAHLIGEGFDRGEVRVIRSFDTPLTTCKELLFSVEHTGDAPRVDWFTTTACRNGSVWQWAAAEPAIERWGNLQ